MLDGQKLAKPSQSVDEALPHTVTVVPGEKARYVSRGGLKLEAALEAVRLKVSGLRCADIGASTGGFTDCLLRHGAACVYALDAGHDQLAPQLREDPRVVNIEGFNARRLCDMARDAEARALLPEDLDLAVMDVSFISQTYILPGIPSLLRPGGLIVSLIKPQFEVGRGGLGKGGIVRDPHRRAEAVLRVLGCAREAGLGFVQLLPSPITGGDGNCEYLLVTCRGEGRPYPEAAELMALVTQK